MKIFNMWTMLFAFCGVNAVLVWLSTRDRAHQVPVHNNKTPPGGAHASLVMSDEVRWERSAEAIAATWSECSLIYFLHISKTGGTHLNHCIKALQDRHPDIQFTLYGNGLDRKSAAKGAAWLGWGSRSAWLDCVKANKLNRNVQCTTLQPPWNSHKVILSSEGSFKQYWAAVLDERKRIGPEVNNGTCYVSIVREPQSWLQSAYNHARRNKGNEFADHHMLHETNNFEAAYFEGIGDVAKRLTVVSTERVGILFEALRLLLQEEAMPSVCDPNFSGKHSNVQKKAKDYDASVDWCEWVHAYNSLDVRLYDVLKSEYDGVLHVVAPEGRTVGAMSSAASFFDVVKEFQWQKPLSSEAYSQYIATHRRDADR